MKTDLINLDFKHSSSPSVVIGGTSDIIPSRNKGFFSSWNQHI